MSDPSDVSSLGYVVTSPGQEPEEVKESTDRPRGNFSLQTLFIVVSLICISLSLMVIVPLFGIPFSIVELLAWLRTVEIVRLRAARGVSAGLSEKARWFAGAFGYALMLVTLTLIAGIAGILTPLFAIVGVVRNADPVATGYPGIALLMLFIGLGAIFAIGKTWEYGDRVWRLTVDMPDDGCSPD